MDRIWDIWSKRYGIINIHHIMPNEWLEIQEAAKFKGVSGRSAYELVANENGHLYLIDSCGEAYLVNPCLFVAVSPNKKENNGIPSK